MSPGSQSGHRISGFSWPHSTPTVVPVAPGNFPNRLLNDRFSSIRYTTRLIGVAVSILGRAVGDRGRDAAARAGEQRGARDGHRRAGEELAAGERPGVAAVGGVGAAGRVGARGRCRHPSVLPDDPGGATGRADRGPGILAAPGVAGAPSHEQHDPDPRRPPARRARGRCVHRRRPHHRGLLERAGAHEHGDRARRCRPMARRRRPRRCVRGGTAATGDPSDSCVEGWSTPPPGSPQVAPALDVILDHLEVDRPRRWSATCGCSTGRSPRPRTRATSRRSAGGTWSSRSRARPAPQGRFLVERRGFGTGPRGRRPARHAGVPLARLDRLPVRPVRAAATLPGTARRVARRPLRLRRRRRRARRSRGSPTRSPGASTAPDRSGASATV